MKRSIAAIALAGCLMTNALAAPLSDEEHRLVIVGLSSLMVTKECGNYKYTSDGIQNYADQQGVDFKRFSAAIWNAMKMLADRKYDRNALIPEVTRDVKSTGDE